jgi:hypothetical protein
MRGLICGGETAVLLAGDGPDGLAVLRFRPSPWSEALECYLDTSEDDIVARALYESLGFSNREGRPDGPLNYFYEREL